MDTIITCGCSATDDAIRYGDTRSEDNRCIGCGTPVEPKRPQHASHRTDCVTEYGVTYGNPFKVF